jgi:pumilio RNA-binding family
VQFIVDAFKKRVYEMSVHQFGCRVIQRMLEHCEESQIRPVLNEVFERVLDLTKDMYGNYVISHVLEHGMPTDKLFVINKIKKKVLMLANHKFGSNVIEKCLVHSDKRQKEEIINEILLVRVSATDADSQHPSHDSMSRSSNNHVITLQDLMRDKYGNYVIQRVVEISDES